MGETPKTVRIVAAVIERDGKYLITQRREGAVLPLLWEFPGGRVEPGETDGEALEREVHHRLGAHVRSGKLMSYVSHPYDRYTVDLFLYECALLGDVLEARAVKGFRWVTSQELEHYEFTPADEASMSKLLGM